MSTIKREFKEESSKMPPTITHSTLRSYAPFKPHCDIILKKNRYKARDLLNFTVMAFFKRNERDLSPRQNDAKDAFQVRYGGRRLSAFGIKPREGLSLTAQKKDVQFFAEQLDKFFFFEALGPHIDIKSGSNVVGRDPLGIDERLEGETFSCRMRNREFVRININIGPDSEGKIYKLDEIIGQLMHEMIHAYFLVFACNCEVCGKNAVNTVGIENDGHGPVFLMLHCLILNEIRRWHYHDNGLRDILKEDCPGITTSKSIRARAQKALAAMSSQERMELNKPRGQNSRSLIIRLNAESTKVIVKKSLRKKQLLREDILRINAKRNQEFDNELAPSRQGSDENMEEDSDELSVHNSDEFEDMEYEV
ncbi:hypothetical protein F4819DRAFT_507610 [Hypoxylon fuscum]|nr:hypothetical protein F4819DRAFT_507610 [Hypoxylon fuscum]